jgi:ATP-dependent metalloprotease
LLSRRPLSYSRPSLGIFGSSATPDTPAEQPLTTFQARIAQLETDALSHPDDADKQSLLLKELLEGGEARGVVKYYEAIALNGGNKTLLRSEEALSHYLTALGKIGRLGEVAGIVRRRDAALGSATPPSTTGTPAYTPPTPSASSPSSPPAPGISSLLSPTPTPVTNTAQPGSPLSPIYVQMAPVSPQMNAMKAFRWVLGMLFWGFIILTLVSMLMENTGLLKAGPGPAEFEPEEGKVVKFSDVHGVEEAKSVCCNPRPN